MRTALIAPCGMNCGICMAYLREKNHCPGCRSPRWLHPECLIRTCADMNGTFCFSCSGFPCRRLKHQDGRYRTKYCVSMIGTLDSIRAHGIRKFVAGGITRWTSTHCGGTINVQKHCCSSYGWPA